jgi:hypothetical protein
MPVYVFREGISNVFKIGLTWDQDVTSRRRSLNSGSSAGLREFEVIETDAPKELETFLHHLLKHRNVARHGGTEFFEMLSENHMREFLRQAQPMFQRSTINKKAGVFEKVECEGKVRSADISDIASVEALRNIEVRLREIEDEAAFLRFEKNTIECELKSKIGNGPGIEGVATWESSKRRNFCLQLFQEREPDTYQDVLERFPTLDVPIWRDQEPQLYREITSRHPKLDTSSWMKGDNLLYRKIQTTHYTPSVTRKFVLLA